MHNAISTGLYAFSLFRCNGNVIIILERRSKIIQVGTISDQSNLGKIKKHDKINAFWVCWTAHRAGWTEKMERYRIKDIFIKCRSNCLESYSETRKICTFLVTISLHKNLTRYLIDKDSNIWRAYSGYVQRLLKYCYELHAIIWWDLYIL